NHTRKELLFLMFKEINLRNHSSLHKLFYSLYKSVLSAFIFILIPYF
ncbi:amino acid ABC transporter permease, partial [Lactobacillus crispatus]|nr:amino acid ABC transporter permease [Lactobacillus crispatus]